MFSYRYISVFIGTRYSFNKSGKKVRDTTENLEFIISESIYNYRETLSQLNHNLIFKNYLQEAQKARYNTAIVNSLRVLPRNELRDLGSSGYSLEEETTSEQK